MKIPSLLILMLTLLLLAPVEGGSARQGSREDLVTTVYLPPGDLTLIYSELGELRLNPSNRIRGLSMQISAQYKGQKKIKPELVQLRLGAHPRRWSLSDERTPRLLVFADGRTFDADERDKKIGYSVSLDFEMMDFALPREQFLRVARARTVRLQLDGVDFDLTDAQLKRLKAFAKEIQ